MKRTCEETELDLVMRDHGALVAMPAVEEHLAECESCRRFAATGSDVEVALRRIAERDAERVDWQKMKTGIHTLQRNQRLKMWLAPLFLLQVPLVVLVGTGQLPSGPLLFLGAPLTVLFYVGWIWLTGLPFREILAVVTSDEELQVAYQRELRRRKTRARIFAVATGLIALASAVVAIAQRDWRVGLVAAFFAGWSLLEARK